MARPHGWGKSGWSSLAASGVHIKAFCALSSLHNLRQTVKSVDQLSPLQSWDTVVFVHILFGLV